MNKLKKGTKVTLEYNSANPEVQEQKRQTFLALKEAKLLLKNFPKKCTSTNHMLFESTKLELVKHLTELKNRTISYGNIKVMVNKQETFLELNAPIKEKLVVIQRMVDAELKEKRKERANRKFKIVSLGTNEISLRHNMASKYSSSAGRTFNITNKAWSTFRLDRLGSIKNGFVHAGFGDILKLKEAHKVKRIFDNKLPKTAEHHLGIEIEFFCDLNRDALAQKLVEINEYLCLKGDSSIHPDSGKHSHELVICVPQSKRYDVVNKVCSILREANAKVNNSCGLHVHLDMRTRDRDISFSNLVAAQDILYAMNPVSRRGSSGASRGGFSKPCSSREYAEELRIGDRYKGINPMAWEKFKTLEVRIHSGTTDATKINNWITILEYILKKDTTVSRKPGKIHTFAKAFDLPEDLVGYMETRASKFLDSGIKSEDGVA